MSEAGAALVDVYQEIVTARDAVYQAQRAWRLSADSPFDGVARLSVQCAQGVR